MAEGQVYVEVDASVINGGVMPMAIVSSNPEPSDDQHLILLWLRWWYNDETGEGGFTGLEWYCEDSNNALHEKYPTDAEFIAYLTSAKPKNLDHLLGTWDKEKKIAFIKEHGEILSSSGCIDIG